MELLIRSRVLSLLERTVSRYRRERTEKLSNARQFERKNDERIERGETRIGRSRSSWLRKCRIINRFRKSFASIPLSGLSPRENTRRVYARAAANTQADYGDIGS